MKLRDLVTKEWRVEDEPLSERCKDNLFPNYYCVIEVNGERLEAIARCRDRETATAIAALPKLYDLALEVIKTSGGYSRHLAQLALDAANVADEQEVK